jgi:hypothetical protein
MGELVTAIDEAIDVIASKDTVDTKASSAVLDLADAVNQIVDGWAGGAQPPAAEADANEVAAAGN